MKQLIIGLGLVCLTVSLAAQNETDALRFSHYDLMGTGRFAAVGGASTALGADLSSLHINPAGLGLYRRSDLGLTFQVGATEVSSLTGSAGASANQGVFGISSIGAVWSFPTEEPRVNRFNFGITYAKRGNFNERIEIQQENSASSLMDIYALQANGSSIPDLESDALPFGATLAWYRWLINPIEGTDDQYERADVGRNVNQQKVIEHSGSMGEIAFSAGVSLDQKWYIGAALTRMSINYEERSRYTETVIDPVDLIEWTLRDSVATAGTGFNAKLGVIYKVSDYIRIGANVETPTWLGLGDRYETSISSTFLDPDDLGKNGPTQLSPIGEYNYRLRTPARYGANAAALLGKHGFIAVDYQYVDYGSSKLREAAIGGDGYPFSSENTAIEASYRGAHLIAVGAELKPVSWLALRGGVRYEQSPYTEAALPTNTARWTYTGGLGARFRSFYADLSLMVQQDESIYYLYDPDLTDASALNHTLVQSMVSVGWRY